MYTLLDRRHRNTILGRNIKKTFNFLIFLDGTNGFHDGQVDLQNHLSVGQVDFLTKFVPWWCMLSIHGVC